MILVGYPDLRPGALGEEYAVADRDLWGEVAAIGDDSEVIAAASPSRRRDGGTRAPGRDAAPLTFE